MPFGDVQASLPGRHDACATTSIRIIGGVRQIQTIKSENTNSQIKKIQTIKPTLVSDQVVFSAPSRVWLGRWHNWCPWGCFESFMLGPWIVYKSWGSWCVTEQWLWSLVTLYPWLERFWFLKLSSLNKVTSVKSVASIDGIITSRVCHDNTK